jgi:hypothetical protein
MANKCGKMKRTKPMAKKNINFPQLVVVANKVKPWTL